MPYDHHHYHDHHHQHSLEVSNVPDECPDERAYTPHGEAQRHALVHAAYELIAKEGFEGLRTRDVAKRAGVNVATLHYYFATKEDLIRGVVEYIREQFAGRHAPTATPPTTGMEELRQELADQEYLLRHAPETFIVLFELGMRSLRDPFIKSIMPRLDAGWREHVRTYLAEGVQQGAFRADLDIEAASAALIAFLKGCILQRIINPQAFPAEQVYAEIEHWLTGHAR
jgi:AcrR family transcriptional regulator